MSSHYFDEHQTSPQNRKVISFRFLSSLFTMISDDGVFNKEGLDTGSKFLLEVLLKQDLKSPILDFGSGLGVIGIILKTFKPEIDIEGFDINHRAVELSKENSKLNKVDVSFTQNQHIEKMYQTIILNPPIRSGKANIYAMFKDAYEHLEPQGQFYIVMRKQHGALSAIKELESYFASVEIVGRDKGFYVILSRR